MGLAGKQTSPLEAMDEATIETNEYNDNYNNNNITDEAAAP